MIISVDTEMIIKLNEDVSLNIIVRSTKLVFDTGRGGRDTKNFYFTKCKWFKSVG